MLDKIDIKVGDVFFNINKSHIGTITKIDETFVEYEWKSVDGTKVWFSPICLVPLDQFKKNFKHFIEMTPLEKELF